jgi:hypothetical protein
VWWEVPPVSERWEKEKEGAEGIERKEKKRKEEKVVRRCEIFFFRARISVKS